MIILIDLPLVFVGRFANLHGCQDSGEILRRATREIPTGICL